MKLYNTFSFFLLMNRMVSKEEENFLRIVHLNYSVATRALTTFFDKLHPDLSADLHITGNKATLKQLLNPPPSRKRVLYQGQWDILYPPTRKFRSENVFSITWFFSFINDGFQFTCNCSGLLYTFQPRVGYTF